MPLPAMYTTHAAVEAILAQGQGGTFNDAQVDQDISTAGQLINAYCRRHFDLVSETRTFDAPGGTALFVADLQASPTPTLTQDGTALVAGTDYVLQPQITALHPAYTYIQRLSNGLIRRWGYRARAVSVVSVPISRGGFWDELVATPDPYGTVLAPSARTITIAGTWGYAATVPGPIQQAAEMLAVRIYQARVALYLDKPGLGPLGQTEVAPGWLTQDIKDLLDPYVRAETEERDE